MTDFRYYHYSFAFPVSEAPSWKGGVDRWYQLDAFAYGLAEGASQWRDQVERPDFLLLASPGASNESDIRFASSGASSPSKFVHTLPNVRASSFCQVMEWTGPMLCLQNDPATCLTALGEAEMLIRSGYRSVWVMGARAQGGGHYETYLFHFRRVDD